MPVRDWSFETLVNSASTAGHQISPSVAATADGGYIIAWEEDPTQFAADDVIHFQRYDAFGVAVGALGTFGGTTFPGAARPVIAVASNGQFAISYIETSGALANPALKVFAADGTPAGFVYAAGVTTNNQQVIAPWDGGIIVARHDTTHNGGDIQFHKLMGLDADVGFGGYVNATTAGDQHMPTVTGLKDGSIAYAWINSDYTIHARVDKVGVGLQTEVTVNTSTAYQDEPISITALANGGFLVAYTAVNTTFPDTGLGVRARMFDSNGVPAGGEIQLNSTGAGAQVDAKIAALPTGGFVALWFDSPDVGGVSIRGQAFDAFGARSGSEFAVSDETFERWSVALVSAATMADGRVVVTWQGHYTAGADTDGNSIHSVIIDPRDGLVTGDDNANTLLGGNLTNDQIKGMGGDDVMLGLGGDDFLIGGDGNDQLQGGPGADMLNGGAGTDIVHYDNATSGVTVDLINAASNTGEAAGDTYNSIEGIFGSGFGDHLYGGAGGSILYGQGGDDVIYGQAGGDTISGGEGNDVAQGGAGSDTVSGNAGNDVLYGYTGMDFLYGGAGADSLNGEGDFDYAGYSDATAGVTADLQFVSSNTGDAAGDTYSGIEGLIGSGFADGLRGDGGANWIFGGAGDDMIFARGGDDYISGDGGTDTMYGEAGNDTFIHRTGDGTDTIGDFTAGAGVGDVLNILEGASFDTFAEVMAVAAQVGANTVITFAAGDTITLLNVTKTNLATDDFSFA